jgi:hypothetical protein
MSYCTDFGTRRAFRPGIDSIAIGYRVCRFQQKSTRELGGRKKPGFSWVILLAIEMLERNPVSRVFGVGVELTPEKIRSKKSAGLNSIRHFIN